jgi:hypothetical protein
MGLGTSVLSSLRGDTVGTALRKLSGATSAEGSRRPATRLVALNESGTQRIGEDHAGAKLTNAQVDAIRDEFEAYPLGHPKHVGYRLLAKKWGMGKSTIRDICTYTSRNHWAGRWKKV